MAARAVLGVMCRHLWQVPGGLGRVGADRDNCHWIWLPPGVLPTWSLPDIYSASRPIVYRKVEKRGLVFSFNSHGIQHKLMNQGEDRKKKNRRMSELERMLSINTFQAALDWRLQNILRLKEDGKLVSRKLGAELARDLRHLTRNHIAILSWYLGILRFIWESLKSEEWLSGLDIQCAVLGREAKT